MKFKLFRRKVSIKEDGKKSSVIDQLYIYLDCERGFSKQNLIKSDIRNSLSSVSLDNLMCLSINGPEMEKFNFEDSFKSWKNTKARRILQWNYDLYC